MSVEEWPVEVPLVLTGLVGPEHVRRGLFDDPDEYTFREPSSEQLGECQDRINDLPPAAAEVAIRYVAEYLNAVYTQYDHYWDRERGYGLCVMKRKWSSKGGTRALRGDFVLARFREDPETGPWTFFTVRGGCNCVGDLDDLMALADHPVYDHR